MISVSVNRGEPDRICSDSSGSVTEMWGSVALPAGAGEAHAEKCDGERNPVGAAGSSRRHSSQHLLSGPGDRTQTGTFQFSACLGKSDVGSAPGSTYLTFPPPSPPGRRGFITYEKVRDRTHVCWAAAAQVWT